MKPGRSARNASVVAVRRNTITGVHQRSISSTAPGSSAGSVIRSAGRIESRLDEITRPRELKGHDPQRPPPAAGDAASALAAAMLTGAEPDAVSGALASLLAGVVGILLGLAALLAA
mgnify:CR=1 FL=1